MKLSGEVIIEAPADAVWEVVGHRFAEIADWATAIEASYSDGATTDERRGRVCRPGVRWFSTVTEQIVDYDEPGRTLTYAATGLPRFVGHAHNRWQVTAMGPHRARARFDGVLETRGIVGRLVALPLRLRMLRETRTVLLDLKHFAEHRSPSPRKQRAMSGRPVPLTRER